MDTLIVACCFCGKVDDYKDMILCGIHKKYHCGGEICNEKCFVMMMRDAEALNRYKERRECGYIPEKYDMRK